MPDLLERLTDVQPQGDLPAGHAKQHALQALKTSSTGRNRQWDAASILPDVGDMSLAVSALLSMAPADVAAVLEEHASGQPQPSFAQSRRLALVGMCVSSLQVGEMPARASLIMSCNSLGLVLLTIA